MNATYYKYMLYTFAITALLALNACALLGKSPPAP